MIDAAAYGGIDQRADSHQDASADRIEGALKDVQNARHDREAGKGRQAAARQHAIIDEQHEQGAVEHQDVADYERAEQADASESAAT